MCNQVNKFIQYTISQNVCKKNIHDSMYQYTHTIYMQFKVSLKVPLTNFKVLELSLQRLFIIIIIIIRINKMVQQMVNNYERQAWSLLCSLA